MKKFLFIVLLLFITMQLVAQSGVAINTTGAAPDPSAGLDVQFNNKGLLMPRLTTTERNAIVSPAEGLQIYNITTRCIDVYISPMWQSVFCGCNPPAAPSSGTHSPTENSIVWNWNTVSGASGYKYNTVNDYQSATDNVTSTSYSQTGLSCGTAYTLYVWSYGTCGNSSPVVLTQSTSACFVCGTNTVTFTYKGASVTYGTVSGQNSTCWLDRNLGAIQVATAYNDINAYGDLLQWGRLDDGHQSRSSNSTTTLSSVDIPGNNLFITNVNSPWDWRVPQNGNLWQGMSGINNPCPTGWRIPTDIELDNERQSWTSNDRDGAFASILKWTAGGSRSVSGGFSGEANAGGYWSSTLDGDNALYLFFYGSDSYISNRSRANGSSVRCVKN